jgi:hypothetical protein
MFNATSLELLVLAIFVVLATLFCGWSYSTTSESSWAVAAAHSHYDIAWD